MMKKILSVIGILLALAGSGRLMAAADLSQLVVYPNPIRAYVGQNQVTFDRLTPQFRLRIYNSSAVLVRDVEQSGSATQYVWDLRNDSGLEVASGIYIYLLTNGKGHQRSGKILIIR